MFSFTCGISFVYSKPDTTNILHNWRRASWNGRATTFKFQFKYFIFIASIFMYSSWVESKLKDASTVHYILHFFIGQHHFTTKCNILRKAYSSQLKRNKTVRSNYTEKMSWALVIASRYFAPKHAYVLMFQTTVTATHRKKMRLI